jgi:hypothetical protein
MKSLKNKDNNFKIKFFVCFLGLIGSYNIAAMLHPNGPFDFDTTGDEIKKAARLLLASCCIKGHCVCPARWGQCKYLLAHNSYLEKKAQVLQPNIWHEEKRKSM